MEMKGVFFFCSCTPLYDWKIGICRKVEVYPAVSKQALQLLSVYNIGKLFEELVSCGAPVGLVYE